MKRWVTVLLLGMLLFNLAGCEAFTRKFTRKSKKAPQVEMVLAPEEYKPNMTKEELYRRYFLFWKSWQDELISALDYNASLKKKVDCAQEAIKNLMGMRRLLVDPAQKNLDVYIAKSRDLLSDIRKDVYGADNMHNSDTAGRIKADIERGFIYPKVKNYLR